MFYRGLCTILVSAVTVIVGTFHYNIAKDFIPKEHFQKINDTDPQPENSFNLNTYTFPPSRVSEIEQIFPKSSIDISEHVQQRVPSNSVFMSTNDTTSEAKIDEEIYEDVVVDDNDQALIDGKWIVGMEIEDCIRLYDTYISPYYATILSSIFYYFYQRRQVKKLKKDAESYQRKFQTQADLRKTDNMKAQAELADRKTTYKKLQREQMNVIDKLESENQHLMEVRAIFESQSKQLMLEKEELTFQIRQLNERLHESTLVHQNFQETCQAFGKMLVMSQESISRISGKKNAPLAVSS